jgi:hypothetical protein
MHIEDIGLGCGVNSVGSGGRWRAVVNAVMTLQYGRAGYIHNIIRLTSV